jgi:AraC-like DNA-binding protein
VPIRSHTVPVRYIAFACSYAESLGVDQRTLLRAAGLAESLLDQPGVPLTIADLGSVIAALGRLSGRTDVGFELGRRVTIELHEAFGQAMQRCAVLDHALRLLSRYYALITPSFMVEYRRGRQQAEITYRPTVGMAPGTLAALNELHAVSFHFVVRAAVERAFPAYDIYLPMPAPPHARRYRELAPARVHFGTVDLPEIRIVIDASLMDMSMALRDPQWVTLTEDRLREALPAGDRKCPWSDWVHLMLHEAEDCQPTIAQLASLLRLPAHTLARRLSDEGWSFRELSNLVRHDRACEMLRHRAVPISQIAFRLGYSDVGNFSNAFRALSGKSPRRYRESIVAVA